MRILSIDCETRPNIVYTWGLFNQNIGVNQIVSPVEVICWAAKWVGEPKVFFRSVFHDGHDAMVYGIWELLDDADVVMHYNGRRFDVPHLNREFTTLVSPLAPPSPYQQIDLLRVAKKRFLFTSNKLEHVAQTLGVGHKVEHEGFPLWRKCMDGDEKAWTRMRRYNKRDVLLVEALYEKLLPWIPCIPSQAAFSGLDVCPACGSGNHERRGYAFTQQSKYQRYQCRDCGKWYRDTKRIEGVTVREVAG